MSGHPMQVMNLVSSIRPRSLWSIHRNSAKSTMVTCRELPDVKHEWGRYEHQQPLHSASCNTFRQRGVLPAISQEWTIKPAEVQRHIKGNPMTVHSNSTHKNLWVTSQTSNPLRNQVDSISLQAFTSQQNLAIKTQSFLPDSLESYGLICQVISSSDHLPAWFPKMVARSGSQENLLTKLVKCGQTINNRGNDSYKLVISQE